MKFLQNKLVVSVLGVVAAAVVLNNLGVFNTLPTPRTKPADPSDSPKRNHDPGSTLSLSGSIRSNGSNLEQTVSGMSISEIHQRLSQWIMAPRRDPFQHFSKKSDYPGVGAVLKLSGVWRQTGSRLAVINQKVLAEGDVIEDYRIERIEGERVWLQGPVGLEPLDLELALSESQEKRKKIKLGAP